MTTITIKNGLSEENLVFANPLEAMESLMDSMGYVLLTPIKNLKSQARVQKHADNNKNRPLDSYDDIEV